FSSNIQGCNIVFIFSDINAHIKHGSISRYSISSLLGYPRTFCLVTLDEIKRLCVIKLITN
ncbi:hypothetical protein RRA98_10950, partial [Streptococcus pneumoniae]|nr:hypothetical protein [Streptococcus pneumoniae]